MNYPKWVYHRTEAPRVVEDATEHLALGEGWAESPADLETPDVPPEKVARKKASKETVN
jgi:hypothetical protein